MKIGVISDTHGILAAWEKAMKLFEDVDIILHAGDVLYHPPRLGCTSEYDLPELARAMNDCRIPIVIARGNCDSEVYEELLQMPVLSPYALVELPGIRIVVQHGHTLSPDQMRHAASKYHADIFVTGHTHVPVIERFDGSIHLNPGSPSHPKFEREGVPTPTVALISDGVVQVVTLESGETLISSPIRGTG